MCQIVSLVIGTLLLPKEILHPISKVQRCVEELVVLLSSQDNKVEKDDYAQYEVYGKRRSYEDSKGRVEFVQQDLKRVREVQQHCHMSDE